ncbi:hypothetical protein LCGC14_2255290 [marine sediment metagenome]|uniref:Peptidase C1A papain C-terminal domain-containing protein n=1 Tax=marine sediment metagenome TaxID=412755 RepID=A0A0F9D1P7_9ZZZZ
MNNNLPVKLGFIPDEVDVRDRQYDEVFGAAPKDMPDFKKGYSSEFKYGSLRDDHQGRSLACVGFGATSDMEMAAQVFGIKVHFSQRFIYSQIYIPSSGGSSPRNAYKILNKQGVPEDKYFPTPVGKQLTEKQMRDKTGLAAAKEKALKWKIKGYYSVNLINPDSFAQAIFTNHGVGFGYIAAGKIGHFIFGTGYGIHNGYQGVQYQDSYDPYDKWMVTRNGRWYRENITGQEVKLYSGWVSEPEDWSTNAAKKNIKFKLERIKGKNPILLIADNEPFWIKTQKDMECLIKATDGLINWDKVVPVERFSFPYEGRIIGLPQFVDVVKNFINLGKN